MANRYKGKNKIKIQSEYEKFLESPLWHKMRRQIISRDGGKCTTCGSKYKLQVHHKIYRGGIGNEHPSDLITLCANCHKKIHKKGNHVSNKTRSLSGEVKIYTKEEISLFVSDLATCNK